MVSPATNPITHNDNYEVLATYGSEKKVRLKNGVVKWIKDIEEKIDNLWDHYWEQRSITKLAQKMWALAKDQRDRNKRELNSIMVAQEADTVEEISDSRKREEALQLSTSIYTCQADMRIASSTIQTSCSSALGDCCTISNWENQKFLAQTVAGEFRATA